MIPPLLTLTRLALPSSQRQKTSWEDEMGNGTYGRTVLNMYINVQILQDFVLHNLGFSIDGVDQDLSFTTNRVRFKWHKYANFYHECRGNVLQNAVFLFMTYTNVHVHFSCKVHTYIPTQLQYTYTTYEQHIRIYKKKENLKIIK